MRMRLLSWLKWIPIVGACSLMTASSASADRASLVLDQTISGQSNLFRTENDKRADGSYEIRPRLRLERPEGNLRYSLEYSPTYDVYFRTSRINGFDQFGRGEVFFSPEPTGTAWARTDIAYYRSVRSENVDGASGIPEVAARSSGRVLRAFADFGYERELSPTTVANGSLGLQAYDYSTRGNVDSFGIGGEFDVVHELKPSFHIGGLFLASHRRFDKLEPQPSSHNTVLHGGLIVRTLPTPTLTFELQVGPALLLTHRGSGEDVEVFRYRTESTSAGTVGAIFDSCGEFAGQPLLSECPLAPASALDGLQEESVVVDYAPGARPPSKDDETWTGFVRAMLRKDESWGYASLDYFRSEDASSGSGTTSVRDSITATVMVRGGNRWSARLRGNWNQRKSVDRIERNEVTAGQSSVPAGGGVFFAESDELLVVSKSRAEITQYWINLTLRRQLLDALSVELGFRYLRQERDGGQIEGNVDYDNVTGSVMLRYEFPGLVYGW